MALDTLAAPAEFTLEVKHSRFLAQAVPLVDADAAMTVLRPLCTPDATHNCWAFRVGAQYRSSDDGEPAGTAGRPILAAIDGQGYDQVLVVVTRWYGGIKLGAGGLVRAYGGAAAECLRRATRRPLIAMTDLDVEAPFDALGTVHALIAALDAHKLGEHFEADGARLRVRLPESEVDGLKTRLRDATRDRVRVHPASG